jgi:hypothetical protein
MSEGHHPHITRVTVFYKTADEKTRWRNTQDFGGDKEWSAEAWLAFNHAPEYVQNNWISIEVTRESPPLCLQYTHPTVRLANLINS